MSEEFTFKTSNFNKDVILFSMLSKKDRVIERKKKIKL
jgi:hypothetical protein